MLKTTVKTTLLLVSVALTFGSTAGASDLNAQALKLAGDQQYDQALTLLATQDPEIRNSYDHRFLKVRILSWSGRYSEARASLAALIAEFPDNADLELTLGNLEYYQGNLDAAERQYLMVVDKVPGYTDARNGLENVRKAREARLKSGAYTWRIDGSASLSGFERQDLSNWNNQFIRAEYAPGSLAYHGSAQRYKRFGFTDIELKAGVSDAVRGGWDWGVEAGVTPDAVFRPELSLGGRIGKAIKTESGTVIYPGLSYRYDQYDAGDIHSFQPSLTTYFENEVVVTGRLIGTSQKNEPDQLVWLIEGRAPINDDLQMRLGYADAPEAVNGIAVTTQSIFGGLTYSVNDALDVHLNLARDDRENSYIRNSVNVGFTHKR